MPELTSGLIAAARNLGIDPAFAYAAANRGPGGTYDIEGARQAVSRLAPLAATTEYPSLSYRDTMTLIRAMFLDGWESAESLISAFSNIVTDNSRDIIYNALGAPPRMREWLDEIQPAVFNTQKPYPISVRDWEATIEIPKSMFVADRLGQYAMRFQEMGAYAKRHPDTLLLELIAAANATLCYDGQYLCDTDHSEGQSGNQSNKLTTGYDDDEIADVIASLDAGVAAMQGFKDDRGEILDIGWQNSTVYDVLCRPAARSTFNTLATLDMIGGSSNGWKGRLRVHSSARFTVADRFWMSYLNAPSKPFLTQYQTGGQPSDLKELGPDSSIVRRPGRFGSPPRGITSWCRATGTTSSSSTRRSEAVTDAGPS